jgi:arginase
MTQTHRFLKTKEVSVIGVPFNGGQPRKGVEQGPTRLVEFGLLNQIEELGWTVDYEGNENITSFRPSDDPDVLNLKQPKYVSAVTKHVSQQISESASKGNFVLTLGGDHSVALATVSGVFSAYPDACLVWVDAHGVSNIYLFIFLGGRSM